MSRFLGLARTRGFRLLHSPFRIDTEDQPQGDFFAICQLHDSIGDLPWIAFRRPFETRSILSTEPTEASYSGRSSGAC
jgi:hypothetical protein